MLVMICAFQYSCSNTRPVFLKLFCSIAPFSLSTYRYRPPKPDKAKVAFLKHFI